MMTNTSDERDSPVFLDRRGREIVIGCTIIYASKGHLKEAVVIEKVFRQFARHSDKLTQKYIVVHIPGAWSVSVIRCFDRTMIV